MSAQTLNDIAAPLAVLRLLSVDFPTLPAPSVDVSTVYPDRLTLSFHDDLTAFETWRAALGIDPGAVAYAVQSGGRTRVLSVLTEYAGARVRLVGYGSHPDHAGGAG
ncbi:hypothetical protein ACIQ7D_37525 [Streptomyces sp. NPDC096310]|uniref:hypothetical protein n=1 Tax=Streptomyces sp. NPDC096310 TaxID=3366082 RepID=UPI0037FCBC0D